jgi:CRP/FNR family transcriptional regulator, cyclic AMP receptor protein
MALDVLNRKVFQAGQVIFTEGQSGGAAYVVQRGVVEIAKEGPNGPRILGHVPAGGIFGEMALIDNQPRMAGARAIEETVCLVVPKHLLDKKLAEADPFIAALVRVLIANARANASASSN